MALAAAGWRFPLDWSVVDPRAYDFFDLKGDVEDVVERAAGVRPGFRVGALPFLHPGGQAEIVDAEGRGIGFCGELHPRLAEAWGMDERLYVAEWDLARVGQPPPITSLSVPRAPAVERDLALVVPEGHASDRAVQAVREAGVEDLVGIEVFDRYRGPQVPDGYVSLGLRLTFQAGRTLTVEAIDERMDGLIEILRREHGYRRR